MLWWYTNKGTIWDGYADDLHRDGLKPTSAHQQVCSPPAADKMSKLAVENMHSKK